MQQYQLNENFLSFWTSEPSDAKQNEMTQSQAGHTQQIILNIWWKQKFCESEYNDWNDVKHSGHTHNKIIV